RSYAGRSCARGQYRLRGVVTGDAADAPAAPSSGSAHPDVVVAGLDPPAADLVIAFGIRPREVAVEDVAARHPELGLDLGRRQRLEAGPPISVSPQALLERLGEHRIDRAQRGCDRRALSLGCRTA